MPDLRRVAVIVPIGYRGGTLRAAKLISEAIWLASRDAGQPVEVVLGYLSGTDTPPEELYRDLPSQISCRTYSWRWLDQDTSCRAMHYAGQQYWTPSADRYLVAEDGIQQFCDCDLWVVISDRLQAPLLPLRPYVLMVYDYVQRYDATYQVGLDDSALAAARSAAAVLVTTRFTQQGALNYAGVERDRVVLVPMLVPLFDDLRSSPSTSSAPYFLWATNRSPHKNQGASVSALRDYYELFDGKLNCHVCGVDTDQLLKGDLPHLKRPAAIVSQSRALKKHLRLLGELPDPSFRSELAQASFLWHPTRVDNGTFTVVEAAYLGVPSLSTDYPAMREMDAEFQLGLTWMEGTDPSKMGRSLKQMEEAADGARNRLPDKCALAQHNVANLATYYWKAITQCL